MRAWHFVGTASAAAIAFAAHPALAQTATAADAPGGLSEIVVTARRTAENLQSVPVAVTAVGAVELERRQILDIKGLEAVTPNLVINPNTLSANGANIFIRGVGVGDIDRTFNPAVQVVIDGVTFGSSGAGQLVNVVDVERIEVLRGPQGTLFGANAIGGVISITRPKPRDEFGGAAQITVGNYNEFDFKGSLTGPLVPGKLDARIALNRLGNDGQFINVFNGKRKGFVDIWSVSAALRFTPSDNVEVLLAYDYTKNQSDWGVLFNRSGPNDLLCLGFFLGQSFCDNPRQDLTRVNQDTPTFLNIETHSVSLTTNIKAGDVDITSITGFNLFDERKQTDFDAVPIPVFASAQPVTERQFAQEFRANWKASDRLSILGGFYGQLVDYTDGANSLFIFSLLGFPPNTVEVVDRRQKTYSFGAFLSGNYNITDSLRLSVGGRFTYEYKDFIYRNGYNQSGGGYFPAAPGFNNLAAGSKGWSQFTPRVAIDFKPKEDVLIYASWSQGFKSGGFNGRGNSTDTIGPYNPETADSFEVGLKSQWFDRRLRFNLAGFYNDYNNKQEEIIRTNPDTGATITTVTNAASVRYYGFELEWAAIPFEGFTLSGTGAYLNAKYNDFRYGGFDVSNFVNVRNAPRWQFSVTGQYERTVGSVRLDGLLSYRWTDDYFTNLGPRFDGGGPSPLINDPRSLVKSYGLVDASIGATFRAAGTDLRLSLYGKNLADKRFYNVFLPVANLWNMSSANLGRTFGVKLGVTF